MGEIWRKRPGSLPKLGKVTDHLWTSVTLMSGAKLIVR